MKYIYIIIIAAFFITPSTAQFDVKLNVDNVNKRLRVFIRNTVSNAPTTSQNISSINMKLLGPKVGNIISIHSGDYTIQMPNPDSIITMSSVSLPSPTNWMQNTWYKVVTYNLTPGMEYTTADFSVQPDLDMDNSDVFDAIMSVQAIGLFNIPLNIMSTTLPVRLVSFDAVGNNEHIDCSWTTSSEVNNAGFEIQKSSDGLEFEMVGWVDSKYSPMNLKQYSFTDKSPFVGNNYYRLKQVDNDGKYWLSDKKLVRFSTGTKAISIFPNPVSNKLYVNGLNDESTISIYSSNGKLLDNMIYNSNGIDVSNLTKGVYFLSFKNGNIQNLKKFIVN